MFCNRYWNAILKRNEKKNLFIVFRFVTQYRINTCVREINGNVQVEIKHLYVCMKLMKRYSMPDKMYCWRHRLTTKSWAKLQLLSNFNYIRLFPFWWWIELFFLIIKLCIQLKYHHVFQQQTCVVFILILISVNIAISQQTYKQKLQYKNAYRSLIRTIYYWLMWCSNKFFLLDRHDECVFIYAPYAVKCRHVWLFTIFTASVSFWVFFCAERATSVVI